MKKLTKRKLEEMKAELLTSFNIKGANRYNLSYSML